MSTFSFFSGIIVTTFLSSALFFLKFWRVSRDRFFLFFSVACVLISMDRIIALFIHATQESLRSEATDKASWVYLLRLLAFVVLMIAIVDKNRSSKWK